MEKIWNEAQADLFSTRLATKDSMSYIRKGVKMENKKGDIKIYNTKFGNDFYT